MKNILIAMVFVMGTSIHSACAQDCSDIEDNGDRLACFDQKFPTPKALTGSNADAGTDTEQNPDLSKSEPIAPVTPASPAGASVRERSRGGIFDSDEAVDFEAQITSLRVREKQRPVYGLSNGQVWMQDSTRPVGLRKGDSIRIKNAKLQGYMLVTEHGRSVRVLRLQ